MTIIELPTLIDCHVHFREPGLEHKGDMHSESAAAHAGGIGVVCEMPNTSPPTQTKSALQDKVRRAMAVRALCDIRFFFGATALPHLETLASLWTAEPDLRARLAGLKLYLDHSTGDMRCASAVPPAAFALCARLAIPLVAHCEDARCNAAAAAQTPYTSAAAHSLRRPPEAEGVSVADAIAAAAAAHAALHIAHLSTADALQHVRGAKAAGLAVTCEVSPHHLFLTTADYAVLGAGVKVNPPIRAMAHREALWEGVLDGTIDCVATDHAPHTRAEKDAEDPPSGMPSIEVVVPLLLTVCAGRWPHPTEAMPKILETKRLTVEDIVRLMHTNPNRIFNLGVSGEKTRAFDLDVEWVVDATKLKSKCQWSPYENWHLIGKAV